MEDTSFESSCILMNIELFILLFTLSKIYVRIWMQSALSWSTLFNHNFCGRLMVNRQIVLAGEQTQSRMVLQRAQYMECRLCWALVRVEWFAVINLGRGQVSLILIFNSHKFNWYEVLSKTSWEPTRQAVLISWKLSNLLELGTNIPAQYEASECFLFHAQVQQKSDLKKIL